MILGPIFQSSKRMSNGRSISAHVTRILLASCTSAACSISSVRPWAVSFSVTKWATQARENSSSSAIKMRHGVSATAEDSSLLVQGEQDRVQAPGRTTESTSIAPPDGAGFLFLPHSPGPIPRQSGSDLPLLGGVEQRDALIEIQPPATFVPEPGADR